MIEAPGFAVLAGTAVVKAALRMLLRVRRFDGRIPALLRCVTHSRTSEGMIWFIRIGPNQA
jgi:hypothetical protein